jgi:hypothetical protein
MINNLADTFKQILGLNKSINKENIECAIDDNIVDCVEIDEEPYIGVPAPTVLSDDPWFGPAVISDANRDYMEQEIFIKQQQYQETHSVESEDIHQVMYEMSTKSSATTLQLDPIGGSENFQGGSENVHR